MENEINNEKNGTYLKEKRVAAGLTKEEMAEKLNVSAYEVSSWEAGFFPEIRYLLPLSELLGVSVEEILRGEDSPEPPRLSSGIAEAGSKAAETSAEPPAEENEAKSEKAEAVNPPLPTQNVPPPPRRQEKSYYEKLNEKIQYTDESGKPYRAELNGFSSGERKFGYIVCFIFILIVLIVQIGGAVSRHNAYIRRDRTLTLENYSQYVTVSVNGVGSFNVDEYDVNVTPRAKVTDFRMVVEVVFSNLMGGNGSVERADFQSAEARSGDTLTKRIKVDSFYLFKTSYKIVSVSGGLD